MTGSDGVVVLEAREAIFLDEADLWSSLSVTYDDASSREEILWIKHERRMNKTLIVPIHSLVVVIIMKRKRKAVRQMKMKMKIKISKTLSSPSLLLSITDLFSMTVYDRQDIIVFRYVKTLP